MMVPKLKNNSDYFNNTYKDILEHIGFDYYIPKCKELKKNSCHFKEIFSNLSFIKDVDFQADVEISPNKESLSLSIGSLADHIQIERESNKDIIVRVNGKVTLYEVKIDFKGRLHYIYSDIGQVKPIADDLKAASDKLWCHNIVLTMKLFDTLDNKISAYLNDLYNQNEKIKPEKYAEALKKIKEKIEEKYERVVCSRFLE